MHGKVLYYVNATMTYKRRSSQPSTSQCRKALVSLSVLPVHLTVTIREPDLSTMKLIIQITHRYKHFKWNLSTYVTLNIIQWKVFHMVAA